jgi:hypothetical protein
MARRALLAAWLLSVTACQLYDFQPVYPTTVGQTTDDAGIIAHGIPPNLMIVVDKSGSMNGPIDRTAPECQVGGNVCGNVACGSPTDCPANCKTRISELRSAMGNFLTAIGPVRTGFTAFPSGCLCENPGLADISVQLVQADDSASLQRSATAIDNAIQALIPSGGTPTSATLQALGQYAPLQDPQRKNFILLLTDGEPNCNAQNPASACGTGTGTCQCTTGTCAAGVQQCEQNGTCVNLCSSGCLDQDGTAATIAALHSQSPSIGTLVVGFGADAAGTFGTGYAPGALSAMAVAGGFPRPCPKGTDAECTGMGPSDTCNVTTHLCNRPFYLATDSSELGAVLDEIGKVINPDPCQIELDTAPTDPSLIAVLVNGQDVQSPGNWTYAPPAGSVGPTITFTGPICVEMQASTPSNPVNVEVRILRVF